ncbi:MAG: DsrE family protein [Geminicoccaceae bacterium]
MILAILALVGLTLPATSVHAEPARKIAIHVDENDPARMNMALNNAANVFSYYESQNMEVAVRIVAYGPGLHMLRSDTSPVAGRISAMSLEHEGLSFAACGNTIRAMSSKAGKDIPLIDEAETVPSGVVELVELQEQGWAYVRP